MPWNSVNVKILHEEGRAVLQCGDGGFTKQAALQDVERKLLRSIELLGKGQEALKVWRQARAQGSSTVLYGDLLFTVHYYDDALLHRVTTAAVLATEAYVFTRYRRYDLLANYDMQARKEFFAQYPGARGMRPLLEYVSDNGITALPPIPYIVGADG